MNPIKRKFVNVTPLSKEAKHRFIHFMNSFHACEVNEERDNILYLTSINKQYSFMVQKEGNQHWKIEK